jgi:hypothetical protein
MMATGIQTPIAALAPVEREVPPLLEDVELALNVELELDADPLEDIHVYVPRMALFALSSSNVSHPSNGD